MQEDAIEAVRLFNRFYTRRVGALNARFLGTDATLPEARVLFEIAHAERPVAADLQKALDMDAGQLSRTLARFEARGWIARDAGEADARRRPIAVTEAGREVFALINQRQRDEVAAMLAPLAPMQQGDVVAALGSARALLGEAPAKDYSIRTFRAGDLGLLAARQAVFYRDHYGWGRGLEINIMEAATHFLSHFREGRDQGWIAEVNGATAGSILVTDEGDGLSRLRLLYVEAMARGRGIGEALVSTCLQFARDAGYAEMMLWTHTVLTSARRIYAAHGFRLIESAWHDEFGEPVEGETWRLDLRT
jgi:DNA-binding MarR family transcriptional regulator/N-acetylglutamate synthase-like GNAT family acetyltransferase